ncbi:MAG: GntR family transcriptional regulator, partial [Planctomycetota bacterium]|nr:GntR family transcriptional regulator [Planctomycetota bacterium]
DRLRPFTELTKLYSTSPGVVTEALEGLEEEGLILRKPRSGCYVTEKAPALMSASLPMSMPTPITASPSVDDAMLAYEPIPSRTSTSLTLATTDCLPEQVAAWRELLETYSENSLLPLPNVHHLRPPFAFAGPDAPEYDFLVGTMSQILAAGIDEFVPVTDASSFGLREDKLIAPLRKALGETSSLPGVPVAMAFPLLFLNAGLAEKIGFSEFQSDLPISKLIAALATSLSETETPPAWKADFGSLSILLVHEGALRFGGNGNPTLDIKKSRALLSAWAKLRNLLGPGLRPTWADFVRERTLVCFGFGFCGFEAKTKLTFPWQSRFHPFAPEALALPLFAAIRRDTTRFTECLDLVEFLCTHEAQRQLAGRGDILPARADCISPAALPLEPEATREELDRWLSRLTFATETSPATTMLISDLDLLGDRFASSDITIDQTLNHIRMLLDRHRASVKTSRI